MTNQQLHDEGYRLIKATIRPERPQHVAVLSRTTDDIIYATLSHDGENWREPIASAVRRGKLYGI